jgi:hypothetical protein
MITNLEVNQNNILKVYEQAKDWEIDLGLVSYLQYHDKIFLRAVANGVEPHLAFGAFAALSPNNTEFNNFMDLMSCINYWTASEQYTKDQIHLPAVTTYPHNRQKALLILGGKEPLEVLRGLKVTNFYRNILNPCDGRYVTIDGHMLSVWGGRRILLKSRGATISKDTYEVIANDYITVARHLNILPNQLQATCWHVWKRIHRIVWNAQMKLWEFTK